MFAYILRGSNLTKGEALVKSSYFVEAIWDAEVSVWVSDTDIQGLVIEADTLAEFAQAMNALAPEMLAANENIHDQRVSIAFRIKDAREFNCG